MEEKKRTEVPETSTTLLRRDLNQALEVIQRFVSESRAGEHKNLNHPAGLLNRALSMLPCVR